MKMRDVRRGYRILRTDTMEQIGEITTTMTEVFSRPSGKYAYRWATTDAAGRWRGDLFWSPVSTDPDQDMDETHSVVVEDEPSRNAGSGFDGPLRYRDFDNSVMPEFRLEQQGLYQFRDAPELPPEFEKSAAQFRGLLRWRLNDYD